MTTTNFSSKGGASAAGSNVQGFQLLSTGRDDAAADDRRDADDDEKDLTKFCRECTERCGELCELTELTSSCITQCHVCNGVQNSTCSC